MFRKVLIANRGEIACRIIKTCRRLGIQTVAVFSEADRDALHVMQADQAVCIGESNPSESYLQYEKIIEVAKKQGAEAIHPGYGFLSENAKFAQACAQAEIVFIGPSVEAIELMGSKSISKELMEKNGVPTVPGYHGEDQSLERLIAEAHHIGFPLLIKASAGGGGKGMRIVESEEGLEEILSAAQREVTASFGDPRLLLERYLPEPRHVEVQIFGDTTGKIFHLFERDCSIQRRYQKIIEEAPAPQIGDSLRERLHQAAIKAAESVSYKGAGTVEFLVNGDDFYFMEMNTRLQVEHPVTEMITGIDLVEWQLIAASGNSLGITQDQIRKAGHAIEIRLCAENPFNNFMPTTGTLTRFDFDVPDAISDHIRVDTGVAVDTKLSIFYDSMIAKIIAWGKTRDQALSHLLSTIQHATIHGVQTNLEFLSRILSSEAFKREHISTKFIPEHQENLLSRELPSKVLVIASCAALNLSETDRTTRYNWRLNMEDSQRYDFSYRDMSYSSRINFCENFLEVHIKEACFKILLDKKGCVRVDSEEYHLPSPGLNGEINVFYEGISYHLLFKEKLSHAVSDQIFDKHLGAPMPGKITNIVVTEGQDVKTGDSLIMMEAMKMEHTIKAPFDGKVISIPFTKGDMVQEGQELVQLL